MSLIEQHEALEGLSNEIGTWARRNFGNSLPKKNRQAYALLRCAAGLVEEFGEFLSAEGAWNVVGVRDAIADMGIYALHFCHEADFVMESVLQASNFLHKDLNRYRLMIELGRLNHACLKEVQGIRRKEDHFKTAKEALGSVFRFLETRCHKRGWDPFTVISEVATKVLQRDWKSNPDDADVRAD